jgi:antitoxin component YwqK of YwqJK toxin-antitoxin module
MKSKLLLAGLLAIATQLSAQLKITDTIFYTAGWRICEQDIASYYRVGVLADNGGSWFYTGPIRDYSTADSMLLMEGNYSEVGMKSGLFKFYHDNGKLMASGNYRNGKMDGVWTWYYPDGQEKAQIYFPAANDDFKFITYRTEKGELLMENGVGSFFWGPYAFSTYSEYIVKGHFNKGLRSGKWDYSLTSQPDKPLITEVYDKDGSLKRTDVDYLSSYNSKKVPFIFSHFKFAITEKMLYDDVFRRNGDTATFVALASYLVDRKSSVITATDERFDSAWQQVHKTLWGFKSRLSWADREVDATIVFKLGEARKFEDITVSGNIESSDARFLTYLMGKFNGIDMPGDSSVAIEQYYTIYVYTLNMSKYLPGQYRGILYERDLLFSALPKQKMIAKLNATKKEVRRDIRKQLLGY